MTQAQQVLKVLGKTFILPSVEEVRILDQTGPFEVSVQRNQDLSLLVVAERHQGSIVDGFDYHKVGDMNGVVIHSVTKIRRHTRTISYSAVRYELA